MFENVDVVILSRDEQPLPPEVVRGIACQYGVRLLVHRVFGRPTPEDECRWDTIVRARNHGKRFGTSRWLMFLDDDVELRPRCVGTLLRELKRRQSCGALAADYLGEARGQTTTGHVGMGATLFRREALDRIHFRWEPERCECQCCCDDLRRQGIAIAYCAAGHACHRKTTRDNHHSSGEGRSTCAEEIVSRETTPEGRVLAAFDRWHYKKFRDQFLASLRRSGNDEWVTAVGYGLEPSQRRALARLRNVELLALPASCRATPPMRRLHDFQTAILPFDELTPVAYWDAGDVVFQNRLSPLWEQVQSHPDKLLATAEPISHPQNGAVANWTLSIRDAAARRDAFGLLSRRPWLAAGFAAATAGTMLTYLRAAERLLASACLAGTSDWGDQTAFNLYCHANPERWQQIDECWNYCLFGRERGEVFVARDGCFRTRDASPIYVVHGNAQTLYSYPDFLRAARRLACPI